MFGRNQSVKTISYRISLSHFQFSHRYHVATDRYAQAQRFPTSQKVYFRKNERYEKKELTKQIKYINYASQEN